MVMVLSFPGLSFLASYLGLTSDINGHRIIRPSRWFCLSATQYTKQQSTTARKKLTTWYFTVI